MEPLMNKAREKIRIVAISDTHSRHHGLAVPDGDILIHAGDATMAGKMTEIIEFNAWLGTLPHRVKLLCAGNHDWLFEKEPGLARVLLTNACYVEDCLVTALGLRIYASPWQPRFFDWAFNLDRGEPLRAKWDVIPHNLDILITHGPPSGILDVSGLTGEHTGCEELRRAVERVRPRVHIFGHIHHSYGVMVYDGIKFVNASICDEGYRPIHDPVVIDLDWGERWKP
jgi:predicted phosphohydrolase